ncbi:acylneuraminate cytidylyltransferase family protein [bacterium]|nr:acylneuraminate cytidylyltransferase family protein [bacterium]
MREILAIIPARGGSKSIKRKNIRLINGKPMVWYSIEACKNSKYITRFVVSTEDEEIKEICEGFGAEVINRPIELAQDETKTAPVMVHSALELEKCGYKPNYITLIQPTSPFRTSEFIDKAFEFYFSQNGYDSCFSASEQGLTHGLWRGRDGKFDSLYDYRDRPRRQDLDKHYKIYCENGAFYTVKYEIFMRNQDFVGDNPCIFVSDFTFDIDEEKDLIKAEELMKAKI